MPKKQKKLDEKQSQENIEKKSNVRQYIFTRTLHRQGKTYAKGQVIELEPIEATKFYDFIMCYREYKENCWCK